MLHGKAPIAAVRSIELPTELCMPGINHQDNLCQIEEQRYSVQEVAVGRTGPDPEVMENRAEDDGTEEQVADQE